MNNRKRYLIGAIVMGVLAVLGGNHPVAVLPIFLGAFLPELDAGRESTHRSWVFHTFLVPALVYKSGRMVGLFESVPMSLTVVNFVALGLLVHFVIDFVFPRMQDHDGASWPVRPTVLSEPWGLIFLGCAWTVQWFWYLVPEFLPWLVGL
ncbi:hypothetical protein SAMN05421858_3197 [Haladaptatus litoreus]|uniref:Uncharacterized protein n=1 Tax=Haladaptatus litoreus TaxID=553468 RepID=A0A1N7CR98_9EURY|nr:hypothetical protein [Haladaptatus litoreus]SIR66123.1 hypothetical protein SAMN05421858_3197 [Haladaptatus litoreus]